MLCLPLTVNPNPTAYYLALLTATFVMVSSFFRQKDFVASKTGQDKVYKIGKISHLHKIH